MSLAIFETCLLFFWTWCNHLFNFHYIKASSFFFLFPFYFWDGVFLYLPEWPETNNLSASASWVLGLQVCTTMSGPSIQFLKVLMIKITVYYIWFIKSILYEQFCFLYLSTFLHSFGFSGEFVEQLSACSVLVPPRVMLTVRMWQGCQLEGFGLVVRKWR
jgi:hypothetical protein